MENKFILNNLQLEDPGHFSDLDPQLRRLKKQTYVYHSPLLEELPTQIPGIYTLSGGRQIGKTTLLKQWMAQLLAQGVAPQAMAFFSGELIDNQHTLFQLLQTHITVSTTEALQYIILDEVTYIHEWDKAIKYCADIGLLENVILILTGSDLILIKEALMRFPGRRGKASQVNFHVYPLSFREAVLLKQPDIITAEHTSSDFIQRLFTEFEHYLAHGGFLTAINDLAAEGKILDATLTTYSEWIRGDILRRGKQEHYLQEIITAIIKRYGSQITWNALSHELSIDHPKTVADYIALLEQMDAAFVQGALLEDKLTFAPKKARKVLFADPFIFHALQAWLEPVKEAYTQQIIPLIADPILSAKLVESCVTTHFRRYYPTYYIKAKGEVDIAYIDQKRFWPIEIKWTNQVRPKDLKQILKYPNSRILAKTQSFGSIQNIPVEPLPLALWSIPGSLARK